MRRLQFRFTVRKMMTVVAILAILAIPLAVARGWLWLRHLDRLWSEQSMCYSSLNNIAMALRNYSESYGRLPAPYPSGAAGPRAHTWRLEALTWMGMRYTQEARYDRTVSWDGLGNAPLAAQVPGFLSCESERPANPGGSPFVMINDFGATPLARIPRDAIVVLEWWGANRSWLDPNDRVDATPRLPVPATDHPAGFRVILGDLRVTRVRDAGRIRKADPYYVLDPGL